MLIRVHVARLEWTRRRARRRALDDTRGALDTYWSRQL